MLESLDACGAEQSMLLNSTAAQIHSTDTWAGTMQLITCKTAQGRQRRASGFQFASSFQQAESGSGFLLASGLQSSAQQHWEALSAFEQSSKSLTDCTSEAADTNCTAHPLVAQHITALRSAA